jgi:beta-lactamase class A
MKSLETGEELAIDADRPMETASTIKLALLTEVFERTLTIKDLATLMVIVSDNTATDVLFRAVGGPAVVAGSSSPS